MTAEVFKQEVLPLRDKVYRLARRLLENDDEAQDISQDVLLKLWTKREQLSKYRSVEAFAMTVTKNMCVDELRSSKRKKQPLENRELGDPNNSPQVVAEEKDHHSIINRLISQLPEQQKIAIHLRDIEGYEFEQISEIISSDINSIRANLSRARKNVRESLTKIIEYGT